MRTFLKNLRILLSDVGQPPAASTVMQRWLEDMRKIQEEYSRAKSNAERVTRQQIMASRIRGSMRFQPDTIAESMLRCSRLPLRTPSKKRCCSRRAK